MGKNRAVNIIQYWLKRVVIISSVPILTAIGVFHVFKALPGSFASEAKIEVVGLELNELSEDERESVLKDKVRPLLISMKSKRSLELLSHRLFIHDATVDTPFTHKQTLESQFSRELLDSLVLFCEDKLARMDLSLSDGKLDSSLNEVLIFLRYDPESLEKRITIRRTPGTNLIGVMARTYKASLSTFMVDQFCREYIRYQRIVSQERLEGALEVLEKLLTHRKIDLEEKRLLLENQKSSLNGSGEQKVIAEILARIGSLEIDKKEEKARIEVLKADLQRFRVKKEKKNVVKAVYIPNGHIWPAKDDKKEQKLLIELGASLAKVQFLDQQIEDLKGKLAVKEAAALLPYEKEVEEARSAYLDVLGNIREVKQNIGKNRNSLKQVKWGKSRMKVPESHKILAILAGIASLFVWVIFLINIEFLKIKI